MSLTPPDPNQARARLIDHFKRVYQIVVGLAITLACSKLFTGDKITLCLFFVFLITVVPIFHGGDRSLDLKYLNKQPRGFAERASYIWDVYMLLTTAVLFVIIAQAIPGTTSSLVTASPTTPEIFYWWMGAMLLFDVGVLALDWLKNQWLRLGANQLSAYLPWAIMNAGLAVICLMAAHGVGCLGAGVKTGIIVSVAAFVRTSLDYYFGRDFLFP